MTATIVFNDQNALCFSGADLKISTTPLTNELKIFDGDKCVFYTSLNGVYYAIVSDSIKMEG